MKHLPVLSLILLLTCRAPAQDAQSGAISSVQTLWNEHWFFDRADAAATMPDSAFEPVTLPHTARQEEP